MSDSSLDLPSEDSDSPQQSSVIQAAKRRRIGDSPPAQTLEDVDNIDYEEADHSGNQMVPDDDDKDQDYGEEVEDEIRALGSVSVELREWKRCNICPVCAVRVNNRNLARHIKENHSDIKYTCPSCSKSYTRKENLDKHLCPK